MSIMDGKGVLVKIGENISVKSDWSVYIQGVIHYLLCLLFIFAASCDLHCQFVTTCIYLLVSQETCSTVTTATLHVKYASYKPKCCQSGGGCHSAIL